MLEPEKGGFLGSKKERILSWRIPGAEDPGGLQSLGLQRVRCHTFSLSFTRAVESGESTEKFLSCELSKNHIKHDMASWGKNRLENQK